MINLLRAEEMEKLIPAKKKEINSTYPMHYLMREMQNKAEKGNWCLSLPKIKEAQDFNYDCKIPMYCKIEDCDIYTLKSLGYLVDENAECYFISWSSEQREQIKE